MSLEKGWGLKPVQALETWDKRIRVVDAIPMYKDMKQGISSGLKIMLAMTDMLGICSMVYLRIQGE